MPEEAVTPDGYLIAGHKWLGRRVCRFFPASGFASGCITAWQPPTPYGDPPLWGMLHNDGDGEDLDEQEVGARDQSRPQAVLLIGSNATIQVVAALALEQQTADLPALNIKVSERVDVYWPGDKQWYSAEVVEISLKEIVVPSIRNICNCPHTCFRLRGPHRACPYLPLDRLTGLLLTNLGGI